MASELIFPDKDREAKQIFRQLGANADSVILLGLMRDWSLWSRWKNAVCMELPDPTKQKFAKPAFVEDFQQPADNAIYYATCCYNMQFTSDKGYSPPNIAQLTMCLEGMAKRGQLVGISELQGVLGRAYQLLGATGTEWVPVTAAQVITIWLETRRNSRLAAMVAAGQFSSIRAASEAFQRTLQQVQGTLVEDRSYVMGMSLENEPIDIRPAYPLVLNRVAAAMGGGVRKKDGTLVIAAQGAGKTVHFCQATAGLFLGPNLKVLGITTEQEPKELEHRNISRESGIPMRKLVDGFDLTKLTAEEAKQYRAYLALCETARSKGARYNMYHWPRGRTGLHEQLRAIVRDHQQRWGGLDVLALDWIGGGMEMTAAAAQYFRFHMQMLADEVAVIAREEDIAAVAYTQARPIKGEGWDNKRVGAEHMQENKTLGNNYTNVLGLSALRDPGAADSDESSRTFLDDQYCFISKSRKGTGGCLKWSRKQFAIQKMTE